MNTVSHLKTIIAAVILLAGVSICHAQEIVSGSVECLKTAGVARLEIDYSKAVIMGKTDSAFAKHEEEWEKDKPTAAAAFADGIASKTHRYLTIGQDIESELTINIEVISINKAGNWSYTATVTNKTGENLCKTGKLYAYGSPVGTKVWRIKTGALSSGVVLGKLINDTIEQSEQQQ